MNMQLHVLLALLLIVALLLALSFLLVRLSQLAFYLLPSYGSELPVSGRNRVVQPPDSGKVRELDKLNQLVEELLGARVEMEEQKRKLEQALLLVEKDNYRKTEELLDAQQLQLSMLPRHTPFYPGYEIALHSQPATEVGGDYYDYLFSPDYKKLHLVLGDATGHGYKPSILVATAKSHFQTLAHKVDSDQLLSQISEAIHSLKARGLYMALSLLRIDGDLITVVSSGMPPVYYYEAKSQLVREFRLQGMFLGIAPDIKVNKKVFRMYRGDVLLLMTDGLAEAQNGEGELLGFEALQTIFNKQAGNSSHRIIAELIEEGERWKATGGWKDDMSLMVIKKT